MADARDMDMFNDWFETLDYLDTLGAEVVVPGHGPQNDKLHPSTIGFTRQYIQTFLRTYALTKDAGELILEMDRIYLNLPVRICLEYSAKILKDNMVWEGDWPLSLRHTPATL